jgi:hypothetical protein
MQWVRYKRLLAQPYECIFLDRDVLIGEIRKCRHPGMAEKIGRYLKAKVLFSYPFTFYGDSYSPDTNE